MSSDTKGKTSLVDSFLRERDSKGKTPSNDSSFVKQDPREQKISEYVRQMTDNEMNAFVEMMNECESSKVSESDRMELLLKMIMDTNKRVEDTNVRVDDLSIAMESLTGIVKDQGEAMGKYQEETNESLDKIKRKVEVNTQQLKNLEARLNARPVSYTHLRAQSIWVFSKSSPRYSC